MTSRTFRYGQYVCECGWGLDRFKERPSAFQKRIELHAKFCKHAAENAAKIIYGVRKMEHGVVRREEVVYVTGEHAGEVKAREYEKAGTCDVDLTDKQKEKIKNKHKKTAKKLVEKQLHK